MNLRFLGTAQMKKEAIEKCSVTSLLIILTGKNKSVKRVSGPQSLYRYAERKKHCSGVALQPADSDLINYMPQKRSFCQKN